MNYYEFIDLQSSKISPAIMSMMEIGGDALFFETFAERTCVMGKNTVYSKNLAELTKKENVKYTRIHHATCGQNVWHDPNTIGITIFKYGSSIQSVLDTFNKWQIDVMAKLGVPVTAENYFLSHKDIRFLAISTIGNNTVTILISHLYLTMDNDDIVKFANPGVFKSSSIRGINDMGYAITPMQYKQACISTFQSHWKEELILTNNVVINGLINQYEPLYQTDSWQQNGVVETSICDSIIVDREI